MITQSTALLLTVSCVGPDLVVGGSLLERALASMLVPPPTFCATGTTLLQTPSHSNSKFYVFAGIAYARVRRNVRANQESHSINVTRWI